MLEGPPSPRVCLASISTDVTSETDGPIWDATKRFQTSR